MPDKNKSFKRILKIFFLSLAFLLVMILLFSNIIISSYIHNVIKKSNKKGELEISAGDISCNILSGNISLKHVNIKIMNWKQEVEIVSPGVYVSGISVWKLIRTKDFEAKSFFFDRGDITLTVKSDSIVKKEIKKLPLISFKKIDAFGVNFNYKEIFSGKNISMEKVNLTLGNFIYKEKTNIGEIIGKQITYLAIEEGKYTTADSLYIFHLHKLTMLPSNKTIVIDSSRVEPTCEAKEFFKRKGEQTDRFDIHNGNLVIQYYRFFSDSDSLDIHIKNIYLRDTKMNISRDRNFVRKETYKKTVQEILRSSKTAFNVENIYTINGRVQYVETQKDDPKPINVWFSSFNSQWTNLNTNDTTGKFDVIGKAKMYDEGDVKIKLEFPLTKSSNYFTATGSLNDLRLKRLNNAVNGNANLTIKEGEIESIRFYFVAGEDSSHGNMKFIYDGLKVQFKDKDTKETKGLDEKIKTFIANNILLKRKNEPERLSYVSLGFKRDKTRFIFNYAVKTIWSGIKETVIKPNIKLPEKKK